MDSLLPYMIIKKRDISELVLRAFPMTLVFGCLGYGHEVDASTDSLIVISLLVP